MIKKKLSTIDERLLEIEVDNLMTELKSVLVRNIHDLPTFSYEDSGMPQAIRAFANRVYPIISETEEGDCDGS